MSFGVGLLPFGVTFLPTNSFQGWRLHALRAANGSINASCLHIDEFASRVGFEDSRAFIERILPTCSFVERVTSIVDAEYHKPHAAHDFNSGCS